MSPYLGMYIHMHWAYGHPYAARTWSLDEWRGYASGLHALGYNMVMIWPITDTMPDPLTPSDIAHLEKIEQIIAMLHDEFGMTVMMTFGPNCLGNAVAAEYTFEDRPFFHTELRLNPGDPAALAQLVEFRCRLIRDYLSRADGFVIIDSDPGGYVGSTNAEFVGLLQAHMDMLEEVAPASTLYYWMWMGWERYNRYWAWVQDLPIPEERDGQNDFSEVIEGLLQQPYRRWAVLSCNANHHPLIEQYGIGDRTLFNPYNLVEYEPSIPLTNYAPSAIADALSLPANKDIALGALANAQTHVVQLPHTYLFAHFRQGGTLDTINLVHFADGVLPGAAPVLVEAWEAIGGEDVVRQRQAASAVAAIAQKVFPPGPLTGLLLGDSARYLEDLALMLRFRADLLDFVGVTKAGTDCLPALQALHSSWSVWTARTGYTDAFYGPVDDIAYEALQSLNHPALNTILADLHDWKKVASRHGIIEKLLAAIGECIVRQEKPITGLTGVSGA